MKDTPPMDTASPTSTGIQLATEDNITELAAQRWSSARDPRTAELLSNLGYRVVTVDISEFEKLEGCVTCLSVRVR